MPTPAAIAVRPALEVAATEADAGGVTRFLVAQDPEGHWIAVEIHGRSGGLFRDRQAALAYAEDETDHRPDAVLLSRERIALQL
ncbi:hypothetical protein J2X36_004568 [Methylobacterium sp. BE186]|uniref:hypothetical protein n=1 Tax=Methylobacterium sp. BE186 TaxID=2817715 RepID=UPI0028557444|nr:hypothetical protein [Methylobacterium sp. BE186]MDR7039790.1 hypothetical protein [Methylobacterium sp. BE186]